MSVNATLDVISMSNWRGDQISAFFFRKIIAVHDSFARLNFYQLLCISPIFKTLVLRSLFPFHSICQFFCHVFFISLSVTPLLYTQPLNRIIGIITKIVPPCHQKHSWSNASRISKNASGVKLFFIQNNYWNNYWNNYYYFKIICSRFIVTRAEGITNTKTH